ncbi:hypothetical protein C4Q31_09110 [Leptospira borgpetersenii serovar Ceylonica]|nr:hypothetical protein C4Q31_09110 [Leptospira borgpetersenii serovar Ceylonica]OOV45840.1 hypothetical protein B1H38_04510 [Leptospira borgpetersenii serovar Ballum]
MDFFEGGKAFVFLPSKRLYRIVLGIEFFLFKIRALLPFRIISISIERRLLIQALLFDFFE